MVDFPYFKCGSKPIIVNLSGMNIDLPAILGFTRCQGFDPDIPDPSQKLLYCIIIFSNWNEDFGVCSILWTSSLPVGYIVWEKLSAFYNLRWFVRSEILTQVPALHACWFFFTAGINKTEKDISIDVPPFCGLHSCKHDNSDANLISNDIIHRWHPGIPHDLVCCIPIRNMWMNQTR